MDETPNAIPLYLHIVLTSVTGYGDRATSIALPINKLEYIFSLNVILKVISVRNRLLIGYSHYTILQTLPTSKSLL